MSKEVNISKMRLRELERAERKLRALEHGGVDNWQFYDECLSKFKDEIEREEQIEGLFDELSEILAEGAYEPSERGAGYGFREETMEEGLTLLLNRIEKLKPKD